MHDVAITSQQRPVWHNKKGIQISQTAKKTQIKVLKRNSSVVHQPLISRDTIVTNVD